jgi:hypothetical protein
MSVSRREIMIGAAASVAAATLPAVAMADVADPAVWLMVSMFGQLIHLLRSQGFALATLADGGKVLVWLDDFRDITSMLMMSLGDDPTPDVIDVLTRTASIDPTRVRP